LLQQVPQSRPRFAVPTETPVPPTGRGIPHPPLLWCWLRNKGAGVRRWSPSLPRPVPSIFHQRACGKCAIICPINNAQHPCSARPGRAAAFPACTGKCWVQPRLSQAPTTPAEAGKPFQAFSPSLVLLRHPPPPISAHAWPSITPALPQGRAQS